MAERVLDAVREVLGRHTSDPRLREAPPEEVSLQSLGIPSVDMISVVIDLEDRFERTIDQSRAYELRTLADLVRALEES